VIEVVAGALEYEGKLLAFQRGHSKYAYIANKFEFPGGKINDSETPQQALKRELKEELLLEAEIKEHIATVEHQYPDFQIMMHCYLVKLKEFDGRLTEHLSYEHISLTEAEKLDWIAADLPILAVLQEKYYHVFAI
jgi:8-oxo-dGTP diphosphatase